MPMVTKEIRVLFVCLGNICRSPMAEAVFAHLVKHLSHGELVIHSDSAGTSGYHVGDSPHPLTVRCCRENGVEINHSAREFSRSDFQRFNYILCMDYNNLSLVKDMMPKNHGGCVELLGSFDPDGELVVDDPYGMEFNAYKLIFNQINRTCEALLKHIVTRHSPE